MAASRELEELVWSALSRTRGGPDGQDSVPQQKRLCRSLAVLHRSRGQGLSLPLRALRAHLRGFAYLARAMQPHLRGLLCGVRGLPSRPIPAWLRGAARDGVHRLLGQEPVELRGRAGCRPRPPRLRGHLSALPAMLARNVSHGLRWDGGWEVRGLLELAVQGGLVQERMRGNVYGRVPGVRDVRCGAVSRRLRGSECWGLLAVLHVQQRRVRVCALLLHHRSPVRQVCVLDHMPCRTVSSILRRRKERRVRRVRKAGGRLGRRSSASPAPWASTAMAARASSLDRAGSAGPARKGSGGEGAGDCPRGRASLVGSAAPTSIARAAGASSPGLAQHAELRASCSMTSKLAAPLATLSSRTARYSRAVLQLSTVGDAVVVTQASACLVLSLREASISSAAPSSPLASPPDVPTARPAATARAVREGGREVAGPARPARAATTARDAVGPSLASASRAKNVDLRSSELAAAGRKEGSAGAVGSARRTSTRKSHARAITIASAARALNSKPVTPSSTVRAAAQARRARASRAASVRWGRSALAARGRSEACAPRAKVVRPAPTVTAAPSSAEAPAGPAANARARASGLTAPECPRGPASLVARAGETSTRRRSAGAEETESAALAASWQVVHPDTSETGAGEGRRESAEPASPVLLGSTGWGARGHHEAPAYPARRRAATVTSCRAAGA
eukprot:749850-Hanusia_phi.AAC.2